jgi:phosphopantetheinyl transferase (holo-ACP synthase)
MTKDAVSKAAMSTELREEMVKTGMSTELQEEKEKNVMSTELQEEMEKAVVSTEASLSISEHDTLLENLRSEADQARAELIEAKGAIPKCKF